MEIFIEVKDKEKNIVQKCVTTLHSTTEHSLRIQPLRSLKSDTIIIPTVGSTLEILIEAPQKIAYLFNSVVIAIGNLREENTTDDSQSIITITRPRIEKIRHFNLRKGIRVQTDIQVLASFIQLDKPLNAKVVNLSLNGTAAIQFDEPLPLENLAFKNELYQGFKLHSQVFKDTETNEDVSYVINCCAIDTSKPTQIKNMIIVNLALSEYSKPIYKRYVFEVYEQYLHSINN